MAYSIVTVPQPQFEGASHAVRVKNTFIDDWFDNLPQPSQLMRAQTAPPILFCSEAVEIHQLCTAKNLALSDVETSSSVGEELLATDAELPVSEDDLIGAEAADESLAFSGTDSLSLSRTSGLHMWAPQEGSWCNPEEDPWSGMFQAQFRQPRQQAQPMQARQPMHLMTLPHIVPMMLQPTSTGMSSVMISAPPSQADIHQLPASSHIAAPNGDALLMESDGDIEDNGLVLQPQTLKIRYKKPSGTYRVIWVVDARKLRGNDKQAVSPSFDLCCAPGQQGTTFKMMIYPPKGSSCFKKADGHGFIQLKCEEELPEEFAQVSYQFSIGKGAKTQEPRSSTHNFAKSAVCGLPKSHDKWDFNAVVDKATSTFNVVLEIIPQRPALQLGLQ
mmetsp:Transcript_22043/g.38826  ORF Transcript_22043/g.38826 Transcript_22043/m.38826 type:complete len:388 (-) Transcript_22043:213-1376(-)